MGKENDKFSHFAKHRLMKKQKTFCCIPPFTKMFFLFNFVFFETKTLMLNQRHNLKSGKSKNEKGIGKKKQDWKTQKRENISEKNKLQFNGLMLFLSWNKSKEERKGKKERKTRNKMKAKKKTRRKKESIEQERDRERENEKGWGQKRLRRNKGRHSKINKKCPL